MNYVVNISSAAQSDLEKIQAWYWSIHPNLGDDFILSARDAIAHIQSHPAAYPLIHKAFRRIMIRRFPYGIFFRIEGDIIKVSGVLHTSRSPEAWQSRLQ